MTLIIVQSLLMLQALSVTQGFSVSGSDEPLVAALGEDIILPCKVDTPVPLEELELQWIKKDTSSLVYLSVAGQDQPESQHKSYRNRTQIFHEKLLTGDYSLKLKKTEVQDEGKYRCVVHSRTQSEEVVVELKSVERLFVTGTNGPLFVYAGGEIVLNCFVNTHIPIEKLEVQWVKAEDGSETLVHLFVEGEDQPESQNQLYKGRTELFNADGNFSLKLKSVGMKDKGIYKCNVHTNKESAETTIELDVGPSVLHIFLYVFAIGSLLIGLGTVIQAGCYLFSKTQSKMGYYCFYVNISIPHILMAFAFVLWGILEAGNWTETVTCIATNLLRVLVLFLIVSDKLRELGLCQGICFQRLTSSVFLINIIITETVMMESVISEILRKSILNQMENIFLIMCVTLFALMELCSFVIKFKIMEVFFCKNEFSFYIIAFFHYVFLFMYIIAVSGLNGFFIIEYVIATVVILFCLPTLLFLKKIQRQYKCPGLFAVNVASVLVSITLIILFVVWLKEGKGKPNEMVMVVFVYILLRVDFTVFPNKSGEIYITLYLFGSTALIVVNSFALIIEVVILGNTGYRPVGDLVLIILPFESLFLMCWYCLLLYRKRQLSKQKQESDFDLTTTRFKKNTRENRNDNLNSQNADELLQMETHT